MDFKNKELKINKYDNCDTNNNIKKDEFTDWLINRENSIEIENKIKPRD